MSSDDTMFAVISFLMIILTIWVCDYSNQRRFDDLHNELIMLRLETRGMPCSKD